MIFWNVKKKDIIQGSEYILHHLYEKIWKWAK